MKCPHSRVYYSFEHDNYYCSDCRQGMGQVMYDALVALRIVQTGIWRDKDMNACGIHGLPAIAVHAVEKALSVVDGIEPLPETNR